MKKYYFFIILAVMLVASARAQSKRDLTCNMQQNTFQHQNSQSGSNTLPSGNTNAVQPTSQPAGNYNTRAGIQQTNYGNQMADADRQYFDAGYSTKSDVTGQYGHVSTQRGQDVAQPEFNLLLMVRTLKVQRVITEEMTRRYSGLVQKTDVLKKPKPDNGWVQKDASFFYHAAAAKSTRNKNLEFHCQHRRIMFASWIDAKWGWSTRYNCFYYAYGHFKFYIGCHSVENGYWIRYQKNDKQWRHFVHSQVRYECGAGEQPQWF